MPTMSKPLILLTLVASNGAIGQGLIDARGLVWAKEAGPYTKLAALSRLAPDTGEVLESVQLSGAEWRKVENAGLERRIIERVSEGQTLDEAVQALNLRTVRA